MPDTRSHRGPHPEDGRLFGPAAWPVLREATADLSWLLSRGYAPASALKLVGDRYQLDARQRIAVGRAACSDAERTGRACRQVPLTALAGLTLAIDGYNVLTTVEAALAGGVILQARDETFRDMASMHGSFRRVAETRPALQLLGQTLKDLGLARCRWYLDRPVSNSGRLKRLIEEMAASAGWPWEVELATSPDALLVAAQCPVASADSAVLDRCARWVNLARHVVLCHVRGAWIVDLSGV